MRPTTMPGATTRSARRLWTWCWTGLGSWQTSARACRVSSSSTASGAALAQASPPFSWSACPWTMARSPSWSLPSTPPPRCPRRSWSRTIPSSPPTQHWSTLTAHSWSTTKQSTTSADAT
uniref:Putative secreted protein n=1 Tax=Ixodes ricinus TaxID=34613 RepID=A0A6B0UMC2_IXORI